MSIPLVPQLLRSHLKELADNDQRLDGRTQYQGRELELEVNVLANAEGSAR
jgi:exosome complex RNA-binding protein Rrp42 (RNase PH superfamily)